MRQYLIEFLGTMVLMYVVLTVGHPLAIGSALAIILLISKGGAFNPAITAVLHVIQRESIEHTLKILVSQIIGAFIAYFLFMYVR